MKRFLCNILLLVCVMSLSACGSNRNQEEHVISNVKITILTEVTTETEEILFKITNHKWSRFYFTPDFSLEKKNGSDWEALRYLDGLGGFPEVVFRISGFGKSCEERLPVLQWYGFLTEGEYRLLVKESSDSFAAGYFTVTKAV